MKNENKYLLAGSIIAGVGTVYGLQRNIDSEDLSGKIENNKEKFMDIIEELVSLTFELLEKILKVIKKIIRQIIFKFKMAVNI